MTQRTIIKSISDKRTYKAITLKNGLECLIISDPDSQKSAAALSVGIGSFLDPLQAQGLAHYLEHMLFMGTQKYPQQNEYSNFLSKNAGSSNAYTSLEETNYYFQVSHSSFLDALDRFSRFFIDPLMLDSSSERQLNAVHSEHSKNLQSDLWRKYQLSKYLAKPGHPYNKFSTGDKTTLANPNLRDMLFNFYKAHYSANLMKLTVYGQSDVQSLAKQVQAKFDAVPNHSYQKFILKEHPYGDKIMGKLIKITPVKDKRVLGLTWILNNQSSQYKHPPSKYVSHIIGHEGKGSLLSFLISEGLATALSSSGSDNYDCYSELQISITLTDKGVKQYRKILGYVFHFIKMLKEASPQQWVVDQIKRVNKMKFDFLDRKQGMSFCSGISKHLHKRKLQEILAYPYFMDQFRPDLIANYLQQLTVQNLFVDVESKQFELECTETEPIYQSRFVTEPIGQILPLQCKVSLPEHNTFIPDDLSVIPLSPDTHPKKLFETEFIEVFFKQDHEFSLPKAQINIRIYFAGNFTVRQDVVRTLFSKMLKQKLRQFTYMAEMAELQSGFSFSAYFTLNIKITGFRDSFERFTNQYLKQIIEFIPDDGQLFATLKEKQKKQYANFFLNNPYQLAYDLTVNALRDGAATSHHQQLKQIDNIDLSDLTTFAKAWKDKLYLEFYMSGNALEANAAQIAKQVETFIKQHSQALPKSDIGAIRPVELPIGKISAIEEVLKSKDQTNNSIIVHYQYGVTNTKTKILQDLALAFVKEPAFDYLRTKEQLGYIVMCLPDDNRGVLGLSILVQSNIKNTYELQKYVNKFIDQILKENISNLDEKVFNEYKNALQSTKKQKDKNLSTETARFWGQIIKHSYLFTRKQEQLELIPKTSLQQFKQFLNTLFYQNPKIFQIHQISQISLPQVEQLRIERLKDNQNVTLYANPESFRKKMPLFPDIYGHV